MGGSFPPALILMGAAALLPLFSRRVKPVVCLAAPLLSLFVIYATPQGAHWSLSFLDYQLVLGQVDRLSKLFGYIFSLIAFLAMLFAWRVDDDLERCAALVYAGSTLGVTFAGDFFSLYIFWELMAVASTFLILARRTPAARRAAARYLLVHLFGGLFLLAGILMRLAASGKLAVEHVGIDGGAANWLIFIGIAVNAAIPPLHPWLKDAYPKATATGAVFLSALTTKSAVYVMARTFAGAEVLIWLGAFMTLFPIFYAVLENDVRGVLSYSLINQVGFMMCGVGIGTPLALNGAVSHAFAHILYKALLFMSAGAVMYRTGKTLCTDLGGLYKYMPLTATFCIIGTASISAFPLFSGFVTKSMIVSAAGAGGMVVVWLMLQFAGASAFPYADIKVPFFMFFGHDSGLRPKEAPLSMLLAMGGAAFLCVLIGVYPQLLYGLLPYPVDYVPYTGAHVMGQLQLLMFGALAFCLLMLSGIYPAEQRAINLDFDWFYRKGGRGFYWLCDAGLNSLNRISERFLVQGVSRSLGEYFQAAPARLALLLLRPLWAMKGLGVPECERREQFLRAAMEAGGFPVGWAAAVALIILIFLFVL
ncbi:MAG: Na(+)/H(+) antiporter subunit D [Desulfarculus sp.]|jgi:multicomponent Na+:H+ antiporter subunit D|nr:MAG: Na(+)/H(+) antiporter subunit D [Desulfarculus sp.]